MHQLLAYLQALSPEGREAFAERCGTKYAYLRKALYAKQDLGVGLCIAIERETKGKLRCEQLRPDGADWAYIRGTKRRAATV
jgi:DNA-binding transcriptional regulator YdaS (Cro superfamily)